MVANHAFILFVCEEKNINLPITGQHHLNLIKNCLSFGFSRAEFRVDRKLDSLEPFVQQRMSKLVRLFALLFSRDGQVEHD